MGIKRDGRKNIFGGGCTFQATMQYRAGRKRTCFGGVVVSSMSLEVEGEENEAVWRTTAAWIDLSSSAVEFWTRLESCGPVPRFSCRTFVGCRAKAGKSWQTLEVVRRCGKLRDVTVVWSPRAPKDGRIWTLPQASKVGLRPAAAGACPATSGQAGMAWLMMWHCLPQQLRLGPRIQEMAQAPCLSLPS